MYCRMIRSPSLLFAVMANNNRVSGVSRCFVYLKRLLPSTLADIVCVDMTVERMRKRPRLSVVNPSGADILLSDQDYRGLFCPHKVKSVSSLMPRQDAHLVAVADLSRLTDVALTGFTSSLIATWRDGDDDGDSETVYRTCGRVSLSAADVVDPQLSLLFNSSSILSGL